MGVVHGVARGVAGMVNATTAAAGAVSGAAVSGVVGGVRGTADGIRAGLSSGSHSTPAAALTLAAFGAVGLVEWPVLLVVGGTALAVRQLTESRAEAPKTALKSVPTPTAAPTRSATDGAKAAPRKTAPRKTAPRKTAPRTATKSVARKAARTPRSGPSA